MIVIVNCDLARASATELDSSQTGYVLNPADNPFAVVAGANIDTSAHNNVAIFGDTDKAGAWELTNNGNINSGYFGVQFDSPAVFVNNGKVLSGTTTSVALYSGGNVTNSAGALIAGRFDGIYANNPESSVTNAGNIGGSASDIVQTQSAIHFPKGGTVTNLVTGRIVAYGPGILANSATTIQNAGLISSLNGTAIDLSVGETSMSSVVSNSGTIIGQGGTAIRFGTGDNTLMMTGTSVITGIVDATAHGASAIDTLILGGTSAGTFDLSSLGATAQYRGFDTLRKNDSSVWTLSGISNANQTWLVGGGGIAMAGQLNGNLVVTPGATGIDIDVLPGGSIRASSASAVSLNGASRLVNSGSIIGNADGVPAVVSSGAGTSVVNTGSIAAQGRNATGVAMDALGGAASLTNQQGGSITSATGVAVSAGSNVPNSATTIQNAGLISSLSGTAIDLSVGETSMSSMVSNSGTIIGQGGTAIRFGPGDSTLMMTGTSVITGIVDATAHGASAIDTLILGGTSAGNFDLSSLGATAQYRGFDTLRKNDSGVWTLSGISDANQTWLVSGGGIAMAGQLKGNLVVTPGATGIDIDVLPGGSIRASSASAVSLNGASRVVNSGSIIGSADGVPAVASSGAGTSVVNTGSIAAQGRNATGVAMDALGGAASLTNQQGGSITSATGVAVSAGSNVSILNAGMLAGIGAAVRFTGANDRLTLDTGSNLTGDLDGGNGAANALVLQGSGTLTSRTHGFSTLTMQGTDWTVAGSVEINSASTIGSGTVRLTGTLTSPEITVAPNAVLTGTGTLQGALAMQGVIAPGAVSPASAKGLPPLITGTLSVAGSYRQAANSLYEAAVTPQGNDLISVAGKATLGGGTVQALVRADSFMVDKTYEILSTTDGLTGTFAGVTTLNPFISPSLIYDANNAYLHVQGDFQFAGGTPNQIAVEAALDHSVAGIRAGVTPTRDFLGVIGNLLNLEGSSAYAALDQLSAEAYAAFADAHFEAARLGLDAIDSRLSDARATGECAAADGAPSSASHARACSWVSLLGSTGRTGGYDTWLGQQTGLAGVISGLDYRVVPHVMVGAALAYVHGNTSTDTLPVHGQFDSYQAALYGSYVPGLYWLQASLGYARNDDEMHRSLFFTEPPRTALGEADGNQYFVSLRNGVDVSAGKYGVFSPFVALELQRAQSPAFIESGADAVDLAVSGNAENSVRSLLGAQWRNGFDWLGHAWSLGAELAWVHQYGSLTRTVDASFEGAPGSGFTEHGSGPAGDAAQIGIGTRVALGKRLHAFVRYDGEFGGRGHSNAGSAGFDYRW